MQADRQTGRQADRQTDVSGVAVRLGLAVHPSLTGTGTCSAVQLSLLQLMPAVLLCGVPSSGAGIIAVLQEVALSRPALCEVIPFAHGHGDKRILALWS